MKLHNFLLYFLSFKPSHVLTPAFKFMASISLVFQNTTFSVHVLLERIRFHGCPLDTVFPNWVGSSMGRIIFLTISIPLVSVVLCLGLRPRAPKGRGAGKISKTRGMGSFCETVSSRNVKESIL